MKNTHLTKTLLGGALFVTILSGCSAAAAAPLDRLIYFANTFETNTTSFVNHDQVPAPSFALALPKRAPGDMTTEQKALAILAARDTIRATQAYINETKDDLKVKIADVKAKIAIFKENGLTLTIEEKDRFIQLRDQIRTLTTEAKATRGLVYEKLSPLRGMSALENIDLFYDTFMEAAEVMASRQVIIDSFNAIINEVQEFLTLKVG